MSVQKVRGPGGEVRWTVRWRPDGVGGPRRRRTFDNETDALEFEVRMRRQRQLGAYAPAEPSRRRLGDYLVEWWDAVEIRPNTRRVWKSLLNTWIAPYLGSVRLSDLGPERVRQWRRQIRAAGCSQIQANRAQTVLSAALGVAIADRLLPGPNPCREVRKPEEEPRRPRALSPEEVERLRLAMPTPHDALLVAVLCYAGPRPAEALAIGWRDIGHVLTIDAHKTYRRRTVEIVDELREDLEALRPRVLRGDELVFANRRGRPWNLNNWRARVWAPAVERAGIAPATPYDGRHTFASLLIHEGRSMPYVAAALGSSQAIIQKHYSHLFDDARLAVAEPMAKAIAEARAAVGHGPEVDPHRVVRVLRQPTPGR